MQSVQGRQDASGLKPFLRLQNGSKFLKLDGLSSFSSDPQMPFTPALSPISLAFRRILHEIEASIHPETASQTGLHSFSPFDNLSAEQQLIIFNYTETWLKVLKTLQNENENWLDSRKLLRAACRELNILPAEDLFDQIDGDDIVEIYHSSGLQIFRSFNLFLKSYYSIETILCSSWEHLIERDQTITQKIWQKIQELTFNRKICTQAWQIEPHLMYETHQGKKQVLHIELKVVSTFIDDAQGIGFISTGKLKRIGSKL